VIFLFLSPGALTTAIGLFLLYVEPFMMSVDMLASIINQNTFKQCLERLEKIDEKLSNENIYINYAKNTGTIYLLGGIAILFEFGIAGMNIAFFNEEFNVKSLLFLLSGTPMFLNTIAKIWFVVLVIVVRDHFRAINTYFVDTKNIFHSNKVKYKAASAKSVAEDVPSFLSKEIMPDFQRRNNWTGGEGVGGIKRNVREPQFSIISKVSNDVIHVMPYRDDLKEGNSNSTQNSITDEYEHNRIPFPYSMQT
jgi:type IV secretory pathway VirB3-like protein